MPKKPKSKRGMRKTAQLAPIDPVLERELDALDAAMLAGGGPPDLASVERLVENPARLPEVFTRRLISGRARVPLIALELITMLGGSKAPTLLRRIAQASNVHDIIRFGAQRRAGWPERTEAKRRLTFLDSLEDPDGTLVLAVDQATGRWPPASDILQEVLGYLRALPAERGLKVVQQIAGALGARASWLLQALLHLDAPPTQWFALDELVRLREPGAVGPISRLAKTTAQPELQAAAQAAARRLSLRPLGDGPARTLDLPPIDGVLASTLDPVGGQVILVARRSFGQGQVLADFFHDDESGIKGAFGFSRAVAQELDTLVEDFEEQGIYFVDVDLAAVRGTLAAALERNVASGLVVPPEFELWEPLLHDSYPPLPDEPLVSTELDDAPYANRDDLLRGSGELAEHPFFETWIFGAEQTALAMLLSPPPTSTRWTDRQYRPLIEQLLDPLALAQVRRALRRQAWLLEQDGDALARDRALATAAHLASADPSRLYKLPFLRRLVARSVNLAVDTALDTLS